MEVSLFLPCMVDGDRIKNMRQTKSDDYQSQSPRSPVQESRKIRTPTSATPGV
jgi:hypothetical protein